MKILKFSASWCAPCKQLAKTLDDMGEFPVEIESYDVDVNLDETTKYGIRGVPTMILVDESGEEIKRVTGAQSKEKILEFVKV